jgi:hypothetical protein
MFRTIITAGFVASISILVSGCYSPARRLDVSAVKPITIGMTRAEVERRLGEPREIQKGSNGAVVARYFFHEFHHSEEASRYGRFHNPGELLYRTLTVLYSANGLVEKKLHDESISSFHREWNGWVELGPPLTSKDFHITKGSDTGKSLLERFGEPTVRTLNPNGQLVWQWLYFRGRPDRLGQPFARLLTVTFESDVVQNFTITDADPRFWPTCVSSADCAEPAAGLRWPATPQ